ncbi:MAG: DUF1559 domain-containing protein [Planctomycetota bacterium]
MKFRLTTVFYLFALLAASLGAFGGVGSVVAVVVAGMWLLADHWRPRARDFLVIGLFLLFLTLLLSPALQSARESSRSMTCRHYLKCIALAASQHDVTAGALPRPYLADAAGKPFMSWRAALLPYVEQPRLHSAIDYSKAWDDPANLLSTTTQLEVFQCPSCRMARSPAFSSFYAVVDPLTMWPPDRAMSLAEASDGTENTVLLIEGPPNQSWAEPKDLTFGEAVELLASPVVPSENGGHVLDDGYFYKPRYFRNVAMADGSVHQIRGGMPRELALAALTATAGDDFDGAEFLWYSKPRLDEAKVARFWVFVAVALAPALRYLRRTPVESTKGAATP